MDSMATATDQIRSARAIAARTSEVMRNHEAHSDGLTCTASDIAPR